MSELILKPSLSLSDAFVLISIAHGLLVCFRLVSTRGQQPWWLITTVVAICVVLANYVARRTGLVSGQYSLQIFSLWFLIAPSYYIHIMGVQPAGTADLIPQRVLAHLVLPLSVFLIALTLPSRHVELFFHLAIPTFCVQSLYYFYRTLQRITEIERLVKMSGSDSRLIEIGDTRWLNALFLGWLLLDSGGSIWMLWQQKANPLFSLLTMLLLANWLYLLVAKTHALRRFPGLGRDNGRGDGSGDEEGNDAVDAGLPPVEAGMIAERLWDVLNHRRAYLSPELRVSDLARQMEVPPYKVTQLLNGCLGVSFYDVVNAFRVRAAAHQVVSGKRVKYLAVAFESGFSSESSFYRIFRRYTGTTPSKVAGGRDFPKFPAIDRIEAMVAEHQPRTSPNRPIPIKDARRRGVL